MYQGADFKHARQLYLSKAIKTSGKQSPLQEGASVIRNRPVELWGEVGGGYRNILFLDSGIRNMCSLTKIHSAEYDTVLRFMHCYTSQF